MFLVSEVGTSQRWALKRVECHSTIDVERVRREIEVHERFGSHPNILALECLSDELIDDTRRFSLIFIFYKVPSNMQRNHAISSSVDPLLVDLFPSSIDCVSALFLNEGKV